MPLTPEQQAEITEARSQTHPTLRATVPGIEAHLYTAYPVLDHGFVRVIDYMGDDAAITQAARVSYGRGTKKVTNDEGLIRYLMRHWRAWQTSGQCLSACTLKSSRCTDGRRRSRCAAFTQSLRHCAVFTQRKWTT